MKLKRIIIYPKDVQRITGKSDRFGRKLLSDIKEALGKERHQYVTLAEFAKYTGIDECQIEPYLTD